MKTKPVTLFLLVISFLTMNAFSAKPDPNPAQLLRSAPLWGKASPGDDGAVQLAKLESCARKVCEASVPEIRKGLVAYLEEAKADISYRLDNARIVCAILFKVSPDHPFSDYFDRKEPLAYKLSPPTFLADVNRSRQDGEASIEQFFKEFDRLSSR
jgi:hypothetical protein